MTTIAVVGASGTLGQLVVAEAESLGHTVHRVVRDPARDAGALVAALAPAAVVVSACGHGAGDGREVVEAAIAAGRPLVDLEPEQAHVRWITEQRGDAAREAGVTLLAGAGLQHAIGDALTAIAAASVEVPAEAHVAYTLPDRRSVLGVASPGRRAGIAVALGAPAVALVHGEWVEELPGETRRLAWFPRPVGPSHAAAVPGGEALSVPRHLPAIRTVRTYLAVPSWRAELLQAVANAARWAPARRVLERRIRRARAPLGPRTRGAIRWGCVAEVAGIEPGGPAASDPERAWPAAEGPVPPGGAADLTGGGVARAWAYGHDPYRLAAATAVQLAVASVERPPAPGPAAPAEVLPPRELLDRLSERGDTRWSLARPEGT